MVLHLGDEDLVPLAEREPLAARYAGVRAVGEGVGGEVERLGGVLGEDDVLGLRTDEPRDALARTLVCRGRLFGERVRPAVRRRVEALVEVAFGIEDLHRLVRRRSGVEVDERCTVAHGAREDREVGPDPGDLLGGERLRCHVVSDQAWAAVVASGVDTGWKRS